MKRRSILTLLINICLPMTNSIAQNMVKLDFKDIDKNGKKYHRIIINSNEVDNHLLDSLLYRLNLDTPDSMRGESAAVVFGNEATLDGTDAIAIIKTDSPEEADEFMTLLENVDLETPDAMRDVSAAVVFGNTIKITDENLLEFLLERVEIRVPNEMKNEKAAVVFGNN